MIIPLHLVPDLREQALHITFDGVAVDPALRPQAALQIDSPIVGPVAGADLQRLHALMNVEGLDLEPTRMVYDRAYAYERLAAGFGTHNEALRELSVDIFADYQQAGAWIGLAH